jgi:hypothetical protein
VDMDDERLAGGVPGGFRTGDGHWS